MNTIDRRSFLKTSGSLTVGFLLFGCAKDSKVGVNANPPFTADQADAWLQVLADGTVQVLTGKLELGQGLKIVMQQVAGEELNINPRQIKVIYADTGITQNEGYTAGSRSVERSSMIIRRAAATARQRVLRLAAERWQVDVKDLELRDGQVTRRGSNDHLEIAALLTENQFIGNIVDDAPLKPKDRYQWVGQPLPHPDIEQLVQGAPIFIQDLRLENMVHARVLHPPVPGVQLVGTSQSLESMPGVLKVVRNGSFAAVITEREFQAVKALEELEQSARWLPTGQAPNTEQWPSLFQRGSIKRSASPVQSLEASYSKPYVMHGSIGPSCALAQYKDGQLQIWSHSQGAYPLRATVSDLLDMPEDRIRVTGIRGAGCYGHNGADDVAAEAALLAVALPGRPIRLMWQRKDEHTVEPYGSAMFMKLKASLSPEGQITNWRYDFWSDAHSSRPRGKASYFVSARMLAEAFPYEGTNRVGGGSRNSEPYYKIPEAITEDHHVAGPLRVSALRSLGAYANIFAIESFMDELAGEAGLDPIRFRLNHLDDERAIAILQNLEALIKDVKTSENQGLGIGFSRYKNTAAYCAVAALITVDPEQKVVTPIKMWAVIEAGEVINPDGLINQTEGGMVQAASWTLKEAVKFEGQQVTSENWNTYRILRMDQVPETEVRILNRPELPPMGAGEAAQGPAAAAIANAVFRATGKRVRDLPIESNLWT